MSFQILYHEISISKENLFDQLFGQGILKLTLCNQLPITIKEFSNRRGLRDEGGVTIHEADIRGVSDDKYLSYVDGKVTITPIQNGEAYICKLELHLHDHFD